MGRVPLFVGIALLLTALSGCSSAPDRKATSGATPSLGLDQRAVERRAFEAVIWGMPAVNYDLMLQAMLHATSARQNEFVYWSKPVDWKNQTLTPNPDAIYFMTFFDTKDGPVVIEVPPADHGSFAGNICTIWQTPLEDAGPNGADRGKGGRYLILPPGYKSRIPPGYIVLRSETIAGYALLRANLPSHSDADVAASAAYGRRLRMYALSAASHPPETRFTDANGALFDATIPYDVRFFQSLDRVVQNEPWLTRDKAMIDQLKSIGIEKGKPFQPDSATTKLLNAAAMEARDWIDQKLDVGFPSFFVGSRWASPAYPEMIHEQATDYAGTDVYPVDVRSMTYSIGYIGIKRLGTAQFYLLANKDHGGERLDGARTYRLSVPPNVPTKQYWSATVYDRHTHALVKNLTRASCASNDAAVQKNGNGSVDIYFGPHAPAGKESNWVPTDPNGEFEVLFRLYGPEPALFEKKWVLPDIELAK
jgi:hypothetical protein